jgi:uncharacterized membrane protein YphA (DoxX/SURF4 family)
MNFRLTTLEFAAGLALIWRRTARAGALTLTVVYSVFALLWVPKMLEGMSSYDPTGNFFEEFSLVAAGAVLFARFSLSGSAISRWEPLVARLFGISAISFGVGHIFDMPGLAAWVPKWIPPSQVFWCYATTMGFFLAAAAILSGIMAPLASRLLTAEIVSFELLVWIPKLLASPHHERRDTHSDCAMLASRGRRAPDLVAARLLNARAKGILAFLTCLPAVASVVALVGWVKAGQFVDLNVLHWDGPLAWFSTWTPSASSLH